MKGEPITYVMAKCEEHAYQGVARWIVLEFDALMHPATWLSNEITLALSGRPLFAGRSLWMDPNS